MGCFLACFGFSKRRKRRKPANRVPSGDQSHGSYKPLDSDVVSTKLDISGNPNSPESHKGKESSRLRIKKKVSFNLNVKTYEPLPNNVDFTSYFSESEDEKSEENQEETAKAKTSTYPSGYRYQNCRDSYDEEDEVNLEESDLDADETEDGMEDYDGDSENEKMSPEKFPEQLCSLPMQSDKKRVTSAELAQDRTSNSTPILTSQDQGVKKFVLNSKAPRIRSQYVFSVLNPVENLTQWKAVKKARETPPLKQQRKENIGLPLDYEPNSNRSKILIPDIAVDASLSNWLVSSK